MELHFGVIMIVMEKIIYEIDSTCKLLRQVFIKNANSIDWEDITQDPSGNMYIGDFGNNNINRKDLTIYKIPNPSLIVEDTIIAESIHFTYLNQFDFPPANDQKNFDMEAMIWYRDSLHLFSKTELHHFQVTPIIMFYLTNLVNIKQF